MAWTSADDEAQKCMEAYNKAHPGPYKMKFPTKPMRLVWKIRKNQWVLIWDSNIPGTMPVAWVIKTSKGYKASYVTVREGPYHKYETRLSYVKDVYFGTLREAKSFLEYQHRDTAMHAMKNNSVLYKRWIK